MSNNYEVFEIYKSTLFIDFWECRNADGQMIGCGETKDKALEDSKTYNGTNSSNMMNGFFDDAEISLE